MSLHAARGGAHEDPSWSALGRRAPSDVMAGDRGGWGGVRRWSRAPQGGPAGAVRVGVGEASCTSTFRELDDVFLQVSARSFCVIGAVREPGADGTVSVLAWSSGAGRFRPPPSAAGVRAW